MKLFYTLVYLLSAAFVSTRSAVVPDAAFKGPLYLSPYIESGRIEEGRTLAQVKPGDPFIGHVKSYSGLLTVDKQYGSNLFFWYFPSERQDANIPLLVWLNGYATASSYGVFLQTGPYDLSTSELKKRDASWQRFYHVVYIDSPVGVGYSFTNSTEGYSTDLEKLSLNLERALEQLLKLFPDLASRELYLTGLSLAGKYIPSLAHRLYKIDNFNLKGIFLGNPVLDLEKQLSFENYLYELGFIEKSQQPHLISEQDKIKQLLREKDYEKFNSELYHFLLAENSYLVNITGLNNIFDYNDYVIETKYYTEFIQREDVRKALHVGSTPYDDGTRAMTMFSNGVATSVLGYLEEMISSIKMMFYAGQTDVCITYPMMVETLFSLNWTGRANYTLSERKRLRLKDGAHVWGYLRNHGHLSDVMVRKAGHSAVTSQPHHVLWLLKKFTNYKRFDEL